MNPLAPINALLQAATAALRAYPLWLAWRLTVDLEKTQQRILTHEAANTVFDRRRADELRISLPIRRRLHDAVLAALPQTEGGDKGDDT